MKISVIVSLAFKDAKNLFTIELKAYFYNFFVLIAMKQYFPVLELLFIL